MELKFSIEESMNPSLHLRKNVPDTQQAKKYIRNDREHIKKITHTSYDENLTSHPQFSKPETGMLKSSPSKGPNVGGINVPTTLGNDHEDLGKSTYHQGQEDLYTDLEGQKKDGTDENNMVAQGNQVRYIDKSGKVTQSEESPQCCLEIKAQDEASTSLNILENQVDVSSVSDSVSNAVEEYEICEFQNNLVEFTLVTKPYDEHQDQGPSEPYQDKTTKPLAAKTLAKAVFSRSIADTKEKNDNSIAHNVTGDQYVGAENWVAGRPTKYEKFMNFHTQKQTSKVQTFALPNKKMTKLCEESISGTNQHEGLEEKTEENHASRVSSDGPNGHFEKTEVPSTYDDLKDENKRATTEPQITNNKDDEVVGKLKKHPNQYKKTRFGLKWSEWIIPFSVVLVALCCTAGASQESTEVSSLDPGIKPSAGSDGEWRVYLFSEEGLYGKNLTFKIGSRYNCELPEAHSYSTAICDNKSVAILGSDNFAALITKYKPPIVFFEWKGNIQVPLTINGTFSNQKDATEYVHSKITPGPNSTVTPNPNSTGTPTPNPVATPTPNSVAKPNPAPMSNPETTLKPNDKTLETGSDLNYLSLIVLAVVVVAAVVVAIADGRFIQWCKNKCRSSEISSPEEGVEPNTIQVTDGTPNIINGHAAHNGIFS